MQVQFGVDNNNDDIHSNANANHVVGILIADYALNYVQNQIIIKTVLHSQAQPQFKMTGKVL